MVPLILPLCTGNVEMFSYIWNQEMLWNDHKYLILLSSIVYDTRNPLLIKSFFKSKKTVDLFDTMSQIERGKFVQFSTTSLEKYFMDRGDNSDNDEYFSNLSFNPQGLSHSDIESFKQEMETVLNRHLLTVPPFSFVNLTENLLPIDADSSI